MRDSREYGRESRRGAMQHRQGDRQSAKKRLETFIIVLVVLLLMNLIFLMKVQSQLNSMNKSLNQMMGVVQAARMEQEDGMLVAREEEVSSPHYQSAPKKANEPVSAADSEEIDYVELCGLPKVDKPVDRNPTQVLKRLEELSEEYELIGEIYKNKARYPEEMLRALSNNPEMADFVSNYLTTDAKASGKGLTKAEKKQDFPLFLQWDPRWGYAEYGDDSNIGLAGCGPTCLSMVIYYLLGDESQTPDVIGDYAMENGYYMSGTGTAWKLLVDVANINGLGVYQPRASEWTLKQELDKGNVIICSMKPGDFTAGGHFIVIYGYDSEGFLINDPNCVARSRQKWTYDEIGRQIKNVWVYSDKPVASNYYSANPVNVEPVGADLDNTESVDDESADTESVSDEPANTEPVHDEPVSSEPVHDEPASSEPVHDEPVSSEPVHDEPVSSEPIYDEPASSEPVNNEPASSEPINNEPASSEPVSDEVASSEPVHDEPVSEPVNTAPDNGESDSDV